MTNSEPWQSKAADLADHLRRSGALTSLDWVSAFSEVPRHVFTPHVLDASSIADDTDASWLDLVYSDNALLTQATLAPDGAQSLPTSSSSQPTIMAIMLTLLGAEPGMRVLEIGTGTGYNAALLSHRLGDSTVSSVEIDPRLVESARTRLAQVGYRPALATGNGAGGMPGGGQFDRIIATCAVSGIPPAWIDQLGPTGRIVAPLAGQGGPLMVLDKSEPDEVVGRFDPRPARFMPMRPEVSNPLAAREATEFSDAGMPHYGTSDLNPEVLRNASATLMLFCQLHTSRLRIATSPPDDTGKGSIFAYSDESLAEVPFEPLSAGRWPTIQRGQRRIWDTLETSVRAWNELRQPHIDRFGITALNRADRQYVWLDDPMGPYSWPLV